MCKDGDLKEDEEDGSLLSILRRMQVIPKQEEDWKCTSIFRTMVLCETKSRMLIIDGGDYVVFEATVERLKLQIEPHPKPYKVAWINSTFILVMKRCLVSIFLGQYNDSIWCDVFPMIVTHILLACPWLLRCVSY